MSRRKIPFQMAAEHQVERAPVVGVDLMALKDTLREQQTHLAIKRSRRSWQKAETRV